VSQVPTTANSVTSPTVAKETPFESIAEVE